MQSNRGATAAAHCVEGAIDDGVAIDGSLLGLDMTDAVARDGTTVVVKEASVLAWDVALLKLATAVDDRPPIPLGRHWVPIRKSKVIAVGYGATAPPGAQSASADPNASWTRRYLAAASIILRLAVRTARSAMVTAVGQRWCNTTGGST